MTAHMVFILSSLVLSCLLFLEVSGQQPCPYEMFVADNTHTGCLPPKTTCEIKNQGVSQADRDLIVRLHNQMRSTVAQGQQSGAPGYKLPTASNMRQLNWNEELASLAQKHTNQCTKDFDCFNCRRVEDYPTGEVIYYFPDNNNFQKPTWAKVINNLALGAQSLRSVKANEYQPNSYTQMIWGMTKDIGCGFTRFKSVGQGSRFLSVYTCLYGPAGNYKDLDIYEQGAQCSDCSYKNTCCDSTCPKFDFAGLCKLNN